MVRMNEGVPFRVTVKRVDRNGEIMSNKGKGEFLVYAMFVCRTLSVILFVIATLHGLIISFFLIAPWYHNERYA